MLTALLNLASTDMMKMITDGRLVDSEMEDDSEESDG